jgi:hypothetical protein
VPKEFRKKLDPKYVKTIFMEYNCTSKACKLWHPLKKQIIICHDVLFQEKNTPTHANNNPEPSELIHVTIQDSKPHATLEPVQIPVKLDMSTKEESSNQSLEIFKMFILNQCKSW